MAEQKYGFCELAYMNTHFLDVIYSFVDIYHEIDSGSLTSILAYGIKKTSRGAKGSEEMIKKTDAFLDKSIPDELRRSGVSRDNNIYGYVGIGDKIIDIANGLWIPIKQKQGNNNYTLLKLNVDSTYCYVSSLDAFDTLKHAIENKQPARILRCLAAYYWKNVTPLGLFTIGAIERPEVMITYDIPTEDITVV